MLTLDEVYTKVPLTLQVKPKPTTLIAHTNQVDANAFTLWAPKRIELFTNTPQDTYAQDWLTQLAIHEFRHIAQMEACNTGLTQGLYYLFGQQALAAVVGLYVPSWFMEGDAVCTETALSKSGRGRMPDFEMGIRAQLLDVGKYPYDKAVMGSYQTHVANQYELGYLIVANARIQYGPAIWQNALRETGRKPWKIVPFNSGLKQVSGLGKEQLYAQAFDQMKQRWLQQDSLVVKTKFVPVTKPHGHFYNYFFPIFHDDSTLIALKSGPDLLPTFVSISANGTEKRLYEPEAFSADLFSFAPDNKPGEANADNLSQEGPWIAWSEKTSDPRWDMRTYSDVFKFNLLSRQLKRLTYQKKYFAPALSPDGTQIAAVEMRPSGESCLQIIDANNGVTISTVACSNTSTFLTPCWIDKSSLVYLQLDANGKSLMRQKIGSVAVKTLIPATFDEISCPSAAGKYILFNASYSGIGNIYALDTSSLQIYQVTSARYGARNGSLSADGKKMVYSNYTASGYQLAETGFEPSTWKSLEQVQNNQVKLYEPLIAQESGIIGGPSASDTLRPKPYRPAAHLFHVHSWAPYYFNYLSQDEQGPGVSVMSQNELSTSTMVAGLRYDMANKGGKAGFDYVYEGWYPKVSLSGGVANYAASSTGDMAEEYRYNMADFSAGLGIPLHFTAGRYYKYLYVGCKTSLLHYFGNTSTQPSDQNGTLQSIDYQFIAYRSLRTPINGLSPRLAQLINISYRHTPWGNFNLGTIFSAKASIWFPGMGLHHSLRMDGGIQTRNEGTFTFPNTLAPPRGYLGITYHTMYMADINYKFPLAYPEVSLGPIMYIKRLKLNVFSDYGRGQADSWRELWSVGGELTADLHLLRFLFPFDTGLRLGYRPLEKVYFADYLISLNLTY